MFLKGIGLKAARTACAIACATLAGACLTPAKVKPTRYLVVTPDFVVPKAKPSSYSLGVRPLEYARAYKERVLYRDGHEAAYYQGVQWTELPRDIVTRALMDAVIATGRYADVGDAGDMAAPDLILTGELRRFEEDRTTSPRKAVCEVRVEARKGELREGVWSETLRAEEPLISSTPLALADAMSRAVGRAVQEAAMHLASLSI